MDATGFSWYISLAFKFNSYLYEKKLITPFVGDHVNPTIAAAFGSLTLASNATAAAVNAETVDASAIIMPPCRMAGHELNTAHAARK